MNILERLMAERRGTAAPPPPPSPPPSILDQILARTGQTLEALRAQAEGGVEDADTRTVEVPDTPELRRILDLPRRSLEAGQELVEALTDALKTPWGQWRLRPIQALALAEIHQFGGLFAPIRVGGGKTLISYLAPVVAEAKRPLLLVPAKLRAKTRREFKVLAYHWNGPHPDGYRIESYELLGRPQAGDKLDENGRVTTPGLLERFAPDLIILDECHKVKNRRAAVTRRISRYLERHPNTRVVAMSGTITKRSLRDYSHIAEWCLPRTCPVPLTHQDLEAWADALDEKVHPFRRVKPGALTLFCNSEEREAVRYGGEAELAAIRQAYRRRMVDTPGVVATQEGPMDMSLVIYAVAPLEEDPVVESHFHTLRSTMTTPAGVPIADGISFRRHAREMGLGFEYIWDPWPPNEWLEIRRAWAKFCREIIKWNRRGLDSEAQVVMAVDKGLYPDHGLLAEWRRVKDTFVPNTVPVWFSLEAVEACAAWAEDHKGILWTEHVAFAEALAKITGLAYYGREGRDATGRMVEDHPPGRPMICSIASNAEGRNLQAWASNLVTCPPSNGTTWEQLLGRTHREGQTEDEVTCGVYLGCWEHLTAFHQALSDARYQEDTTGQAQKLLYADKDLPDLEEFQGRGSFRWAG